jgi:hypothetical protein
MADTNNKKPVVKKSTRTTKKPEEKPLEVVVTNKSPSTFLDKAVDIIKWVDSPFKLATVVILGAVGLFGYITYQNQDKIINKMTSSTAKILTLVEDEKLSSLNRDLLRDLDAETVIIHQIDLPQNLRLTRIAQSPDGRYTPLEGLKGSFFSSAAVRNRASTSILNGEILCEPFEATSVVGDWILSRGVTYTCRGPIPLEAGTMVGYIAVGFKKEPRDAVAVKARINQSTREMTK